jgi:2-(1,2-epoxy-1,2-dihydrophenyl)acetyl-CoA isomerase
MDPAAIRYHVADRVATITLNRPEVMNAFGGSMREDLLARLEDAAGDPTVRCIVITGAGRAFCAGGDITSMRDLQARDDTTVLATRMAVAARLVQRLHDIPKPVIAAVNGAAAGAGVNLALACDLRYGAESAQFAESFVRIGLIPDWGGHYLLTRLVGTARALELLMTGERIDAQEAHRLGILNQVFPDGTFTEAVQTRARRLAAGPPHALAAIKRGVYLGATDSLAATLDFEATAQRELFLSSDAREGMQAFLDKRAPRFGGEV